MNKRRVVITGLGLVTPLGNTVETTWAGILQGKSGVRPIDLFDASAFTTRISASVKNFDPTPYLDVKEVRKNDLFIQYGVAAASQAVEDAGLVSSTLNLDRVGVAIGSGIGGLPLIEKMHNAYVEGGPRKILPSFITGTIINMVGGLVSIKYGFKGPNIAIVTACTTGAHNIGHAARMISYGDAEVVVAGGSEMATTPLGLGGFAAARAMSTRNDAPEKASRPWDKDRDGFVLGDGAGMLVLEEYEHAKKRGAKIYAELIGFGMSGDAHHTTSPQPDGDGFVSAMQNALRDGGLNKDAVDYINAHGTSTEVGDKIEAHAIKRTFGEHAYKLAVSSTKSMIGHLLGAAGAVEAIFCILALRDQIAPPTINLDYPDEGCDLDFVANVAQARKIEVAMSNSFGFGGTNGALLFRRI